MARGAGRVSSRRSVQVQAERVETKRSSRSRTRFALLCAELLFVRGFEWGRNSSPEGLDQGFTHCFIVSFDGPEGRDAYLPHPAHQAFCRRYLDPSLEKACVVDFQSMR